MTPTARFQCPLCGGVRARELAGDAAVLRTMFSKSHPVRCEDCSLAVLHPIPSPSETSGLYEADYFGAYDEADIDMPTEVEAMGSRYERRLAVPDGTLPGRVLDVGVGHGTFLGLAKRKGWEALGIDVSRHAALQARQRYGVDVAVCDDIAVAGFAENHFDLVHLSHSLEHMPNPLQALSEIRRILRPRGKVVIEVPNELENLHVRLHDALGLKRAPYPVRSTHIFFFNPATLRGHLVAAGFGKVRLRTFRDPTDRRHLRSLVKRVAGAVEYALAMGPLIEAHAQKPARAGDEADLPGRSRLN
jgi:SAM-dependent methyltransferase